jgi:hypothetical protein
MRNEEILSELKHKIGRLMWDFEIIKDKVRKIDDLFNDFLAE